MKKIPKRIALVLLACGIAFAIFCVFDLNKMAKDANQLAQDSKKLLQRSSEVKNAAQQFGGDANPFFLRFESAIKRLEVLREQKKRLAAQADQMVIQARQIDARVQEKTSLAATISTLIRSAFDGYTLGAFAEEGIFTENKQALRFFENVAVEKVTVSAQFEFLKRDFLNVAAEEEKLCQTILPEVQKYEALKKKEQQFLREVDEMREEWARMESAMQALKTRMWIDGAFFVGFSLFVWLLPRDPVPANKMANPS